MTTPWEDTEKLGSKLINLIESEFPPSEIPINTTILANMLTLSFLIDTAMRQGVELPQEILDAKEVFQKYIMVVMAMDKITKGVNDVLSSGH